MKTALSLFLILTFVSLPILGEIVQAQSDSAYKGYTEGREFAYQDGAGSGGMPLHFISGLGLGLIGVGLSFTIATSSEPRVPYEYVIGKDREYMMSFSRGFKEVAKKKQTDDALIGGLSGLGVLIFFLAGQRR